MRFTLLDGRYAVARLAPDAAVPEWADRGAFVTITRTSEELSIVTEEENVPADVRTERGWRCLKLEGPIPFETIGVAAKFTGALAAAGVSVFVVSTFDTDYVLVKDEALPRAVTALA
jgi:hypothetical protein